jgi:predicted esterase
MKESLIEFVQQRRYYHNDLNGKQKLLVALHGYGQLGQYFYKKFATIEHNWGILIPEGAHRFYLKGSNGRVGASWMTKEWRIQDIEENNRYLLELISTIKKNYPGIELHLLGFSQGGATAARLYQAAPNLFSKLILWASVFPPDVEQRLFCEGKNLHFVLGKDDPYFTDESREDTIADYRQRGFTTHVFEGIHDLNSTMLQAVLDKF